MRQYGWWVGVLAWVTFAASAESREPRETADQASFAEAAETPDRPGADDSKRFAGAPDPWRDYLSAARLADRIEDPLERCLAYPDLPGNEWPAGHARAHCMLHHVPVPGLDQLEALVQAGRAEQADAIAAKLHRLHKSDDETSESIHRFFDQFEDGSEQAARVAGAWLAARPHSAFAQVAQGLQLNAMAFEARGRKLAAKTPRSSFQRMRALMEEAQPLFRAATVAEPELMDAYIGLMRIGRADSRAELERWAFEQGSGVEPGCADLALERMTGLTPRWGGSAEAMLAYANSLAPHIARRPALASQLARPYEDIGSARVDEGNYDRYSADLLNTAAALASLDDALRYAGHVAAHRSDDGPTDPWRAAALYLQESRFRSPSRYSRKFVGWRLVRDDPEWAIRWLEPVVEEAPQDAHGQYLLGGAYYHSRRYVDADRHFRLAATDDAHRHDALRQVATMWLRDAGLEPREASRLADPYIEQLLRDHPRDGWAHLMRLQSEMFKHGVVEHAMIDAFLQVADADDALQQQAIERIRAERARSPQGATGAED